MPRNYSALLNGGASWRLGWLPAAVLIAAALWLSLHLLEPRSVPLQSVRLRDGQTTLRLEKRRYARKDDWVVRVRRRWGWRTVFYWSAPEDVSGEPPEPRLIPTKDADGVALVVGGRVLWLYDADGYAGGP